MRIIFSRKGIDSTAGGFPSPIFEDGTLFSVPIPSSRDETRYAELDFAYKGDPIQQILNDLTDGTVRAGNQWLSCDYSSPEERCHFDPMPINEPDFEGIAFGQFDKTEAHLRKQGVQEGDVFLFYGWYRRAEKKNGRWRWGIGQDIHLIWAAMTVGAHYQLEDQVQEKSVLDRFPSTAKHPHIGRDRAKKNGLYISKAHRIFDYDEQRCLTSRISNRNRSTWRLPIVFNQPHAFSFLKNFTPDGDEVIINYQGYGQEFVLNLDKVENGASRASIMSWLDKIIA